eukprot:TRINITY_DN86217_c0_g1_i2.p1 TRINITY_DN86217_c0_g1~~TRINITY_DN86217_c0_g1_i2.p1  ORF type:complete len:160 (+),score=13.27 TRINITY_DN86217_c0_g1_i2:66-482(+)
MPQSHRPFEERKTQGLGLAGLDSARSKSKPVPSATVTSRSATSSGRPVPLSAGTSDSTLRVKSLYDKSGDRQVDVFHSPRSSLRGERQLIDREDALEPSPYPAKEPAYSRGACLQCGGEIGRAVQQECRDRSRMPSSA